VTRGIHDVGARPAFGIQLAEPSCEAAEALTPRRSPSLLLLANRIDKLASTPIYFRRLVALGSSFRPVD